MAAVTGRFGEGVLGPLEEGAEVKDDWESPFELAEEPIELTRGDEVLEEYVKDGCGKGSEGSLSFTYGYFLARPKLGSNSLDFRTRDRQNLRRRYFEPAY
ncbi:hypothetical protein F4810DRAFT_706929 [Camillea tinctor]|nr:hypothetical protein F4810DRAFT_706929 [Camillea tinctor]